MAKNKSRRNPKTVLRLPDLEQSKSAVLTSLTSPCRRLLLVSPARCIGSASGEGVHGHDGFPMRRLGLSCPEVGQGNCLGEIQSKGCAWQTPSRRRRNACRFAIALPNRVRVLNRLGISRFRRGNRSRPRGYPGRGSDRSRNAPIRAATGVPSGSGAFPILTSPPSSPAPARPAHFRRESAY